jgi:hypothetical protein
MFGMPQIIFRGPVIRTVETIGMRRMLCGLLASSRQFYWKRRTDKVKTPNAQTVALRSPAKLSGNYRMNPKKESNPVRGDTD